MEYLSVDSLRLDGRRPTELRALSAELSTLSSADGSATFCMGQTKVCTLRRIPCMASGARKLRFRASGCCLLTFATLLASFHLQVMCSVFGPKEVEQRSMMNPERAIVKCEYSMAAFSTGERRRRGKSDRRATEISMVIKNALEQTILLELMPRTQIDVYIQVLQADGGTRSASINAAFLALADAGIPMRDILCCCAGGYLESTALLDMNYLEDSGGGPDVVVGLHPSLNKLVLLQSDNRISMETFEELVGLVSEGCKAIATFMRDVLHKHTSGLAARLLV